MSTDWNELTLEQKCNVEVRAVEIITDWFECFALPLLTDKVADLLCNDVWEELIRERLSQVSLEISPLQTGKGAL